VPFLTVGSADYITTTRTYFGIEGASGHDAGTTKTLRYMTPDYHGEPTAVYVFGGTSTLNELGIGGGTGKAQMAVNIYGTDSSNNSSGNILARFSTTSISLRTNVTATSLVATNGVTTSAVTVNDDAYDATSWNGSTNVPTKNALRDKIESMGGSGVPLDDDGILGVVFGAAAITRDGGTLTNLTAAEIVGEFSGITITNSAAGSITLGDTNNSNHVRITAPANVLTNGNYVFPVQPYTGLLYGVLTADTNVALIPTTIGSGLSISTTETNATLTSSAGIGYQVQLLQSTSNFSPGDAGVYYIGGNLNGSTSTATDYDNGKVYIPKAGTIKSVFVKTRVGGTLGSNESVAYALYINGTTAVSLTAGTADAAVSNIATTGLSTAVSAGDYIALRVTAPSWSTNPTTVYFYATVYIE
jgi:hypothetical protein